jgi:hypothetical protein
MIIFVAKMVIAIAPAFLSLNNKAVTAVIMQLEQESKNEKEDPDKEGNKDKKFYDENCLYAYNAVHVPTLFKTKSYLKKVKYLYKQSYHLTVPTPPPDAFLV